MAVRRTYEGKSLVFLSLVPECLGVRSLATEEMCHTEERDALLQPIMLLPIHTTHTSV